MTVSHFLHAWNINIVDATAEECVATASCSKMPTPSVHPNQDEETPSVSNNIDTYANSITVEGVELPGHRVVDGINLIRNGHGMRSITYFRIGIRIYMAAMYSVKPILSAEQVMGKSSHQNQDSSLSTIDASLTTAPDASAPGTFMGNGPLQLDFTFLRYVRQSQVISAWTQQLDHSVTHRDYEGYEADRDQFIQFASGGPIENHGTQSVQLVEDETRIIDQGKLTGVILGKNFQQSFLSMWFGSMAVSEDLKSNLLEGDEHPPADIEKVRKELQQEPKQVLIEV